MPGRSQDGQKPDAVVADRLRHPQPKRGWRLIRNVVLPRTDPNNPKSSFGLKIIKSDPQKSKPHALVGETPSAAVRVW